MDQYIKLGKDNKLNFKFAQYLLIDQQLSNPNMTIPVPYFFSNKFYPTLDDMLKSEPGAKDTKFTLYKDLMIPEISIPQKKSVQPKEKVYKIGSDSFTMKQLLDMYSLTESQLEKLFHDRQTHFEVSNPDFLNVFKQ